MDAIYTAQFGAFPVRFVLSEGDIFVSKADLFAALSDCFTARMRAHVGVFLEGGLAMLGDASDRRSVVLGDSTIGPAIHFHAAGNLLDSLSGLTGVDGDELRESSFRINALWRWYAETLTAVDNHFGRGLEDMLTSVKNRLDRISPPFVADVVFDPEIGQWVASCDALGVVTEADSYDAVRDRFWEIAPEIAADNGVDFDEGSRVSFRQVEAGHSHLRAAN